NDSRKNLKQDKLDLVLLHCPPRAVYDNDLVFEALDDFVRQGLISNYGVSIETLEDGYKALEKENVAAIEIILNMFRLKQTEDFVKEAKERNVGIIVMLAVAYGLLSGKYDLNKTFSDKDHRFFNREGKTFDKGETFSGVDYELELKPVATLKKLFKPDDLA